jgi:hypothetical protein
MDPKAAKVSTSQGKALHFLIVAYGTTSPPAERLPSVNDKRRGTTSQLGEKT